MGKPVWVLLATCAHWCYHKHCDDCPWYPTARLFRQASPGNWAELVLGVHRLERRLLLLLDVAKVLNPQRRRVDRAA